MRKNFGNKNWMFPMPVLMGEDGTPDVTNASWGGITLEDETTICIDTSHKAWANIAARRALAVAAAVLTMALMTDSAEASDIKGCDSEAATNTLLVKADEDRRPIGVPEDISGIAMCKDGSFWAVCDSRGVLCRLAVDIDPDNGKIKKCSLLETRHVSGGNDMEGLAYDPLRDSLWICDEVGPRIYEYSFIEDSVGCEIDLPEHLKKCIRNRSLEALEITPDGLAMFACNEKAIPGDVIHGVKDIAPVRLSKFVRSSANEPWRLSAECYYLPEQPNEKARKADIHNGVASVCVDSKGRIFILERESDKTNGLRFRVRIFEVVFPSSSGQDDPSSLLPVSTKRLVYEEDTGTSMYEGMCFGPVLKNGGQTLVLVSDGDNKAMESIMTLVFADSTHMESPRSADQE